MGEPNTLQASLLLCDWAEAVNGKLYAQGIGWTGIVPDRPLSIAVAVLVNIPYGQTNQEHTLDLRLLDEDGEPFPSEQPIGAQATFEVGRPPKMRRGEQQNMHFALNLAGVTFPAGGYAFHLSVDEQPVASAPFVARAG